LTNAEKVIIVRRHTEGGVPLNDLGDEYGVSPDEIYRWKRQLAEAAISRRFLEAGLVSREQLRRGILYQRAHGCRTADALIELGFVRPDAFIRFMAKQEGIPSLNLRHYTIDPEVLALVSRSFAAERLVVPVDRLGRLLTVAMACPVDDDTVQEISRLTGLKTKPVFAEKRDVEWAIECFYRKDKTVVSPGADQGLPDAESASVEPRPLPEEDIQNLIRQVSTLPLTPGSFHLLRRTMASGDISEDQVAHIALMDPLVAARLLTLANAETFGQSGKVHSLRKAVELLGAAKACALIVAADTVHMYGHWNHFHFQTYWTDALCCAKASTLVAKHSGMGPLEDFYTAGLLHDIGRIALFEILPLHYAQTDPDATSLDLLIQEKELVGMPHTVAGHELALHWHLPADFAEAIRSHHFPEQAQHASHFAAVVSIGNTMADRARKYGRMDDEVMGECRTAMKMIGLKEQDIRGIYEEFLGLIPSLFLEEAAV